MQQPRSLLVEKEIVQSLVSGRERIVALSQRPETHVSLRYYCDD
ncbi:MAG: hypothetical protein ACI8RD_003694 [Bacillariaceae sp.]|jgi:hypothetical protein